MWYCFDHNSKSWGIKNIDSWIWYFVRPQIIKIFIFEYHMTLLAPLVQDGEIIYTVFSLQHTVILMLYEHFMLSSGTESELCPMMTSSNGDIFTLLALCAGNSLVTGEFPSQRPVRRSFDVFFDLRLNKRLSKQPWRRWFETPSHVLWRPCNGINIWQILKLHRGIHSFISCKNS